MRDLPVSDAIDPLSASPSGMTVLAVDDSRIDLMFMEEQIKALGHSPIRAANGAEALETLKARPEIDVVLLDREMPFMDGLSTVARIKQDAALRDLPIVMVTSADSAADIAAGVEAGVFYYLTKPVDGGLLRSVLAAASAEADRDQRLRAEMGQHKSSFRMIEGARFRVRTHDDAVSLAGFMANWFPQPERAVKGLAELLYNAVEHGSLEIGYDLKGVLLAQGDWEAEVARRQAIEPYASRTVEAVFTRRGDGYGVIITDQGPGFDWRRYLTISPARAGDQHGRGIVHARTQSFDKLSYSAKGDRVAAFTQGERELDW